MKKCVFCGFKTDAPYDSQVLYDHSAKHKGSRGFEDTGMWKDYDAQFSKRFVQWYGLMMSAIGLGLGLLWGISI